MLTDQHGGRPKGCCSMQFAPKTLTIGNQTIDLSYLHFVLSKHSRMAKQGINPLLSAHQELGISRDQLDTICTLKMITFINK